MNNSVAYIDIQSLKNNIINLKKYLKDVQINAVVKGNAYGHGMKKITQILYENGIEKFSVSTIDEAIELRKYNYKCKIYLLNICSEEDFKYITKYDIIPTVFNKNHIDIASKYLIKRVRIEINTGIGRSGCAIEEFNELFEYIKKKSIIVEGVYSHLYANDNYCLSKEQLNQFISCIKNKNIENKSIANSKALALGKEFLLNEVRLGQAIYGLTDLKSIGISLKQLITVKTEIVSVIYRNKGEHIGYGEGIVLDKNTKLGILNYGYSYSDFENKYVMVNGKKANIIGGVNMSNMCIDLTDIQCDDCSRLDVMLISDDKKTGLDLLSLANSYKIVPNKIVMAINGDYIRREYING